MTDLERQITDDLDRIGGRLGALLGLDVADMISDRARSRAAMIAHQLTGDLDDHQAAEVAIDLMALLWPESDPPADWWGTALGRAIACSAGMDGAEAVTRSVAAAMLGVTRGRVTQLVDAGKLDVHPAGGITRVSIAQRLRGRP